MNAAPPTELSQLPRTIALPTAFDPDGNLTFADGGVANPLPFEVVRVYWVTDIPESAVRGGHAHVRNYEVLIAAAGAFTVTLEDQDENVTEFRLTRPDEGLYVPPLHWRIIDRYEPHAVCLVLASEPYDAEEYLRDKASFRVHAR